MSDFQSQGTQAMLNDPKKGAFSKYKAVVVGERGLAYLILYETITGLFGSLPGALGLLCRQLFYPMLLRDCGKGVVFGRNITLRNPGRISIGRGATIDDNCSLDAKGTGGEGITIGARSLIGKGTIISMKDGTIIIDEDCNIGSNVRIGTLGTTRIGKKVLMAAYCYLVGAGHESSRTDIPILDQPNTSLGGVTIGDGSWLGARVTVMDGVTVGADCIVGAHSLVSKDLPDFSVAAGTPAKIRRDRRGAHSSEAGATKIDTHESSP